MDTSRYLDLFVQEAMEHLEALGSDLLEIEREPSGSAVDAAFRHAHSIKGMAASMGFSPIADLAHGLEDLLDLPRSASIPIDSAGIDAALAVADGLSVLVQAAARKEPLDEAGTDSLSLLARLRRAAEEARGRARARDESTSSLPPPERSGGELRCPSTGRPPRSERPHHHLRISVRVAGTSKVPAVRGFLVHKRLSGMGEILSCDPALADLKSGQLPDKRLEVLLSTDAGEEEIASSLGTVSELDGVEVETVAVPASPLMDDSVPETLAAAAGRASSEPIRTVRVRTDLLDGFMDGVGELLLATDRLRQLAATENTDSVSPLGEAVDRLGRIVKSLHRKVMATRMTPLSTVTDRLPRVQREALRHLDKQSELQVEGAEIEMDRAILDEIESPLGHIVRNCIDHGIESPVERAQKGKPPTGKIRLVARRDRDMVAVDILDDGRGLDVDAIKARAVEAGIIDEKAASSLSRREAAMLACEPGLSTATSVTEVSGRGVGLDVVKYTVESLGGSLEIESERGLGTRFHLALPLTVAIQRLLLVCVADDVFAVPVNKVLHVQEIPPSHRTTSRGQAMVPFLDGLVRAYHLRDLLRLGERDVSESSIPHVVVDGPHGKAIALSADRLEGQIEGVVRPLGRPLDLLGGLSGVSMLPDGRPVLVLDLASLVRTAESVGSGARRIA